MSDPNHRVLHPFAFLTADMLDESSPFRDRLTHVNAHLSTEVEKGVAEIANVDKRFRPDAATHERTRIADAAFERIKTYLEHELNRVHQRAIGAIEHVNELQAKKASAPVDVVAAIGRGFSDSAVIDHLRSLPDREHVRAAVFADSKIVEVGEVPIIDIIERQPGLIRRLLITAEDAKTARLLIVRRRSPEAFATLEHAGDFERTLEHNCMRALAVIGNGADREGRSLVSFERREERNQRDANFKVKDDGVIPITELQARVDSNTAA